MNGFILLTLSAVYILAADPEPLPYDNPAKNSPDLYKELKADQALLRKQVVHKLRDAGKEIEIKAPSGEACEAAQRIFSRVSFLFRTREEVLELLGDPGTVSIYNRPADQDPKTPRPRSSTTSTPASAASSTQSPSANSTKCG